MQKPRSISGPVVSQPGADGLKAIGPGHNCILATVQLVSGPPEAPIASPGGIVGAAQARPYSEPLEVYHRAPQAEGVPGWHPHGGLPRAWAQLPDGAWSEIHVSLIDGQAQGEPMVARFDAHEGAQVRLHGWASGAEGWGVSYSEPGQSDEADALQWGLSIAGLGGAEAHVASPHTRAHSAAHWDAAKPASGQSNVAVEQPFCAGRQDAQKSGSYSDRASAPSCCNPPLTIGFSECGDLPHWDATEGPCHTATAEPGLCCRGGVWRLNSCCTNAGLPRRGGSND